MAIGDEELRIAKTYFTEADVDFDVGFEPTMGFVTGSGSNGGGFGSVTFGDYSVPTWGIIDFIDGYSENIAHMLQDSSSVNYFFQYGGRSGTPKAYIGYGDAIKVGGGLDLTSLFTFEAVGTHVTNHEEGPIFGFPADNGRVGMVLTDKLIGYNEAFTPAQDVGDFVIVETPIDIEAIVFFCNSPQFQQTPTVVDYRGGSAFGFVTKTGEMGVVAAGGMRNVASSRFQSDQFCWVSNFTDPLGTAHYGIAEILGNTFKVTTVVAGTYTSPVGFMAIGVETEAPGFFRVIYR
jgi:hypothetical protein